MGIPFIFAAFLVLLLLFQLQLFKQGRAHQKQQGGFWENEEASLFARKHPIDSSEFLHPNFASLPHFTMDYFETLGSTQLYELQQACDALSEQPMLDLSHMLNNEIRHKYGASQLPLIEAYENNFYTYTKNLYALGKFFWEQNQLTEAQLLLEEGLRMGTEISNHLLLLAALYQKTQNKTGLLQLEQQVQHIKSPSKNKILTKIKEARH